MQVAVKRYVACHRIRQMKPWDETGPIAFIACPTPTQTAGQANIVRRIQVRSVREPLMTAKRLAARLRDNKLPWVDWANGLETGSDYTPC